MSRFSTIRRHKQPPAASAAHSPLARNRFGTSSGHADRSGRDGGPDADNRLPASHSEDSVAKDTSDFSKRNSDGKPIMCHVLIDTLFSPVKMSSLSSIARHHITFHIDKPLYHLSAPYHAGHLYLTPQGS